MVLGPLTFLSPLALLGLLALPIIWWVLRITPPKPILQAFPPLQLLLDVNKEEETPQSTPPWLLLFRLFLGALIAIALAGPILFKSDTEASRPLVLVIDNGFASAGNWDALSKEAESYVTRALSENQPVAIFTSVDLAGQNAKGFIPANQALKYIRTIAPTPYAPQRDKLTAHIQAVDMPGADLIWLSDGIDYKNISRFTSAIKQSGSQKLLVPSPETSPVLAGETKETASGFRSTWHRLDTNAQRSLTIAAYGQNGRVIARAPALFSIGDKFAEAKFDLPAQLRNQISRLKPENISSAGSVTLLDDSWGRPLIGLLKGSDANTQPLLSEWHFIEKALSPNADIYKGDLDQLLALSPSIIFMTDRARNDSPALAAYVKEGGMLVRFAGPKLAKRADTLLPITLRLGDRSLGGALAWEDPQSFAEFSQNSPFFGLSTHEDVLVKKQVMASPSAKTDASTWARLQDGSPIITSAPMELGRIVLFHITAGPDWSGLPLSGLYVQMLKRILPLARSSVPQQTQSSSQDWTAERTLNGYGQLGAPPSSAASIPDSDFAKSKANRLHPPGLYRQGMRRQALNTINSPNDYGPLNIAGLSRAFYGGRKPKPLSGILLGIAAGLLALDVLLSLLASGRLRSFSWNRAASLSLIAAVILTSPNMSIAQNALVQDNLDNDALALHLAYVVTGNAGTDKLSKAGLEGLAFELDRRTTIEPVGVRGINIETDELAFYPFLFWPVHRDAKPISAKASAALNAYMAAGGTIVFDTLDRDRQKLLGGKSHPGLAQISKSLDIPRLGKPPKDHVITKSYYLLQTFPGRWADGPIWVELDQRGSARDGVSSVIVGSNDWAAAWAKDAEGRSLTVIENGIPRQREYAYRFGINLAMYALAGNYKSDQVHAATLVERLGTQQENPLSTLKNKQQKEEE